ncbi:MAG: hypothetical protein OQJ99_03320, partial [Rhodospirillales bacterium]|nr:hypothetical protein [Rhodospirillales bacterium]
MMKRGLLIGAGVVIVAIAGAAYFLFSSLDGLVKTAVEKGGSEVTRVAVSLNSAEIGLTEGTGMLSGLTVGNPSGFKTDNAFSLGQVSVKIDTATITSDPVVIKEVVIAAPQVTYELGASGSNIDAIKKNVEAFAAAHGGGQKSASSGEGPKIIIENLYIRDGKVKISAVPLGGKTMDAALPNIHLKDIGKESKGATPAEIAEKVIAALTSSTGSLIGKLDLSGV